MRTYIMRMDMKLTQKFTPAQIALAALAALVIVGLTVFFLTRDVEELRDIVRDILSTARDTPWSFPLVLLLYVIAGGIMFPIIVLNLATAMVFGPLWGFVYAIAGSILSATVYFGIGRFGRNRGLKKLFAGPRLSKIDKKINEAGVVGIATLRLVPVAPFGVFNMVAGITSVAFFDYLAGTCIGFLPGGIARAIVGDSLMDLFLEPSAKSFMYLGCGVVLWAMTVAALHFGLKKFRHESAA